MCMRVAPQWDNQDVVATIKRQLQLLLPGVAVFLDVDDLDDISRLEEYVEASAAFLVLLGSPRYLSSANCLRELRAAQSASLPLVRVHEADPAKNGAPLAKLERACPPEVHGYLFPPAKAGVNGSASASAISWHRVRDFQLISLVEIAEQLLLARPAYDETP